MAPSYKSSEYIDDSDSELSSEEREYEPPNFQKVTPESKEFSSNLKGKEVWLIKLPKVSH